MKQSDPQFFSLEKVFCHLFGHKLEVSKNVTNHIHEYKCTKCGVEMTDTANGLLARLTPKFRETNDYLAKFHKKRSRKIYTNVS